ncbi:bacterial extracellular solute-binding s, 3 family protein [Mycolicibacterium hassiacum DSM 44199]|uniref:Bacterial extracellular solute-binding s, 3 family protein n=1 Tax=Mycolicibacterium hassiacum (strain DSM 44199 / CIP 105218 / JCM 12690 / 3849) TaxID=1122247 RepID=K5B9U5_MYCHD|nr:ABC transporter substrate-binding protein [Mycolicibacterium hassiacum]EKF21100.1 bacterial extracellular solute-binding s, 3 family protein [Mycolicibacterium hassiacum DSM 44199]MDA4087210.1 ABC transporter substrate-binding protein [Mycolicibacterium hassiacum DSM 44199]VCT88440.1 putative histidine-binding protein [Mycolicibacterium hassiacum DSM 44199]
MTQRHPISIATAAAGACLIALTACSSTAESSSPTTGSETTREIVIGTSGDFPPVSFLQDGSTEVVGFEDDLAKAVTDQLGWNYRFEQISFDGLLPALQSGRIDAILSGLYDTEKRREQVDFIDYMYIPLSVLTTTENAPKTPGPEALCGKSVAYLTSSPVEREQLDKWSADCTAKGQPPLEPTGFPSVAQGVNAVAGGRIYAQLEGDITTLYISRTDFGDKLAVAFNVEGEKSVVGMAVAKDSPIKGELQEAVEAYIASDAYCESARKWQLTPANPIRPC